MKGICKISHQPFMTSNEIIPELCFYHRHKTNRKSTFRDPETTQNFIDAGLFCELAKNHVKALIDFLDET